MGDLVSFLKCLADEVYSLNVEFEEIDKKSKHYGSIVSVNENLMIFRPDQGVGPDLDNFVFQGKGTHDIEIKLSDIDFNTFSFVLYEDDTHLAHTVMIKKFEMKNSALSSGVLTKINSSIKNSGKKGFLSKLLGK